MNTVAKENMRAFLKGFASAFDLSGSTLIGRRDIPGGFERDRMMLGGDWMHIGNDMKKAMHRAAHEQ
ncbi:MAG: hypothetical protein LBI06_05755 [Treponema sp.]|nr:hypothetical protein [Treponema sp.]